MSYTILQCLCLQKIARNFELFLTVYSTTKDAKIKRIFEWLKKNYSSEFVHCLFGSCKVGDKHLDFLIHAYQHNLNTGWFTYCQWKNVLEKMVEFGPNITDVLISWYPEEITWAEFFCHLPNLEVISFYGNSVEILRCLGKFCPNIEHIAGDFSDCTETGFKYLFDVPCPKLKSVIFGDCCTVTDDVVRCLLKNAPSLESVDYQYLSRVLYSLHRQDLHHLDKIKPYKLDDLDLIHFLSKHETEKVIKVCLSLCPYVKDLCTTVLKSEHLYIMFKLKHLTRLTLENHQHNFLKLNNFIKSNGFKLTYLAVTKCSLSVLTLAEYVPFLRELDMTSVKLENSHCAKTIFHNLQLLAIKDTEFRSNEDNRNAVCSILSSSPYLDSIAFFRCNLSSFETRSVVLKCCELKFLRTLQFCHSKLDKHFIMHILFTCQSLRTFQVCNGDFDSNNGEEITNYAKTLRNSPVVDYTRHHNLRIFEDLDNYDDYGHNFDNEDDE